MVGRWTRVDPQKTRWTNTATAPAPRVSQIHEIHTKTNQTAPKNEGTRDRQCQGPGTRAITLKYVGCKYRQWYCLTFYVLRRQRYFAYDLPSLPGPACQLSLRFSSFSSSFSSRFLVSSSILPRFLFTFPLPTLGDRRLSRLAVFCPPPYPPAYSA